MVSAIDATVSAGIRAREDGLIDWIAVVNLMLCVAQ
jgi:hypothetical protein